MEEWGLGLDLIIVLAVAIAGGILARWLRLPIIIGYLIGGIAIGPYGFSLVRDLETINTLATIGVILLLFTLGLKRTEANWQGSYFRRHSPDIAYGSGGLSFRQAVRLGDG